MVILGVYNKLFYMQPTLSSKLVPTKKVSILPHSWQHARGTLHVYPRTVWQFGRWIVRGYYFVERDSKKEVARNFEYEKKDHNLTFK